jgi:release factor glutamine methyltransferase
VKIDIMKEIPGTKFDLIVSNPPYISKNEYNALQPEITIHEPRIALTDESDGLTFYHRFAEIFPLILNDNGYAFIEIGYDQKNEIIKIFGMANLAAEAFEDFAGIPRVLKIGK